MIHRNIIWILLLTLLWTIYVLFRTNYHIDSLISDEAFYFHQNISTQTKRVLFLRLVQSFHNWETAKWVITVINLLCLTIAQVLLSEVFLKNRVAAFFWLFYFTAIAGYVFRDTMILLLIALFLFMFVRHNPIQKQTPGNLKSGLVWKSIGLVFLLILLMDFRPHYVAIIAFASIGTYLAINHFRLFILLLLSGAAAFIFYYNQIVEMNIYGISVDEYMRFRAEASHADTSPVAYAIGLVRHFFAPIPTSIIIRLFDPGIDYVYGWLDDTYRLVYRVYVYFCMIYIAVNFRVLPTVFRLYKPQAVFITLFSLSNAILYTAFSFGGGHERTKIFSMMFLVFLFCAIQQIKRHRKLSRQNNHSGIQPTSC